jgi:hypothetical protein
MRVLGKPAGNSVKEDSVVKLNIQQNSHRERHKQFLSGEVKWRYYDKKKCWQHCRHNIHYKLKVLTAE